MCKKLSDRVAILKQNGLIYRHVEPSGSCWIKSMQQLEKQTFFSTCLQNTAKKVNIFLQHLEIMTSDADMGLSLKRIGFDSIIPSFLSLWGNHYKGSFEDAGHVVCPEGLTRTGALLSDNRVRIDPWSLIVSLCQTLNFLPVCLLGQKKKKKNLFLEINCILKIYFSPSTLFFQEKGNFFAT